MKCSLKWKNRHARSNVTVQFATESERFAYEKEMLRDWFRKRFVQMQPPRG